MAGIRVYGERVFVEAMACWRCFSYSGFVSDRLLYMFCPTTYLGES